MANPTQDKPVIKAIAFDAYGTLFDVLSVGALAEQLFPGKGAELANLWRVKQIDYTRLRTLSDRYRDFYEVTRDALRMAARSLALPFFPHMSDGQVSFVADALRNALGRS